MKIRGMFHQDIINFVAALMLCLKLGASLRSLGRLNRLHSSREIATNWWHSDPGAPLCVRSECVAGGSVPSTG